VRVSGLIAAINVYPKRPELATGQQFDDIPHYPTDYAEAWHRYLVQFWAFLVGGRNCVNFFIFRFIVPFFKITILRTARACIWSFGELTVGYAAVDLITACWGDSR
jgi:hypothetical protein